MAHLLLILHLLGVVLWLGGSLTIGTLWLRAVDGDDDSLSVASRNLSWFSKRVAMPSAIVVLLAGGFLVSVANWDFSATWIHIGSGLLILAALLGMILIGPNNRRLISSLDSGTRDAAAISRIRWGLIGIQVSLLVAIWAMVAKPF